MKNKRSTKILSLVLALFMAFSLVPVTASAEGTGAGVNGGWWNQGWGGWRELPVEEPVAPDETVSFPAAVLTSDAIDGLTVKVDAPEGTLPEGTEMTVTRIQNMDAVQAAVDALEDVEGIALLAADITFLYEGKEIQPDGDVTVTMTSEELPKDGELTVVHLDASAEELETAEVDAEPVDDVTVEANSVIFDAASFSTFTVVWTDGGSNNSTTSLRWRRSNQTYVYATIHYVDTNGNPIGRPTGINNNVDNSLGTTVTFESDLAKNISGYTYQAAYRNANRTTPVTSMVGDYDSSYYGTYYYIYNNNTTVDSDYNYNSTCNAGDIYLVYKANTPSTGNKVTIHHGILEGGTFKEFGENGLPASSNSKYPTSLNIDDYDDYTGNNNYAYLIYDFPGYKYNAAYYVANANGSSAPASDGTAILPILQKWNNNSGTPVWWYGDTTDFSSAAANNSHVYVVYEKKTVTPGYDPTSGSGSGSGQNAFTPDVGKNVTNQKPDGTYDITLGFVGDKQPPSYAKARVIVVFDLSGSMDGAVSSTDSSNRLRVAKNAVEAMGKTLLDLKDASGNQLVEMGLVTFGTDADIEHFANNAEFTSTYGTRNDTDTFYGKVESLSYHTGNNAGTNWEKALDLANSMAASSAGKTYVVFISDGDPTFRTSRGDYSDAELYDEHYTSNADRRTLLTSKGIFGYGTNRSVDQCYAAAKESAKSIVEAHKGLYTVGLSSDGSANMQNLATYAGGTYKDGSNSTTFANSMSEIAGMIADEVGLTDVTITDGVTSMSNIETRSLVGTAGNFVYHKSYPLTQNGTNYTYKIGDTTYTVTAQQVTNGTDGTHRIYTRTNSAGNNILYIEYPWDGAPEAQIQADNSVKWDTSSANSQLEHGVYYSVTFTVWPKQEAYDLIADLNNGIEKIAEQTDGIKAQLRVLVDGTTYEYDTESKTWNPRGLTDAQLQAEIDSATNVSFSMKTNTGLSASYEYGGVKDSHNYTNYTNGNMTLDTQTFSIKKNWNNVLPEDSRTAQWLKDEDGNWVWVLDEDGNPTSEHVLYIDLNVTKDGAFYTEERLLSTEDWTKDNIFISLGVLSVNGTNLTVREYGHDYSIEEKPGDAYYWELSAVTYRPMVINKQTTMLVKVEDQDLIDNLNMGLNTTKTEGGKTYYKFATSATDTVGAVYVVDSSTNPLMTAINNRRSYLNLTKTVDEASKNNGGYDEDAFFTYTVKMNNDNLKHPGEPGYNAKSVDGFWFSIADMTQQALNSDGSLAYNSDGTPKMGRTVKQSDYPDVTLVSGANAEEGDTGYYYFDNGGTVTIKIKADWNVRFTNLLTETTYEITEPRASLPDGFDFKSVEATAVLNGVNQDYTTTKSDTKINGEIEETNTNYTVTYTNEFDGYFYVYHSSDNTVHRFPMVVNGVKVTTFNIYDEVKEETEGIKYLYGGYYHAYAGATINENQGATLTYTDNWAEDTNGTAYSYQYIKDSSRAAWDYDKGYSETGTAMTPVANQVYFLKEVPNGYLQPYTHYTYYTSNNKIASMFTVTALDDACYSGAGFLIENVETGAQIVESLTVKPANGKTSVKLTPSKVFSAKGVQAGYIGYARISDQIGKAIIISQFWTTKDGIQVNGATQRYLNTVGEYGYKGKIYHEDQAFGSSKPTNP